MRRKTQPMMRTIRSRNSSGRVHPLLLIPAGIFAILLFVGTFITGAIGG